MAKKESLEMSLSTALKVVWSIAKNQQKEELAKIELEKKEAKMSPAELAESMGLIF
ncbi:MAG: hypothetical protein PVI75_09010 [Gammaproteobacteria bacterium]